MIVSALVLAVIVVGTLTGINAANRSSSTDRARSQADALAQQDEDRLRSEPIKKLSELSETHEPTLHEVDASGTTYVVASSAKYVADATATASCTSTSEKADYIQTTSAVTWNALGKGKPIVETGIVSPPADAALIVHVVGASGEAVSGMEVLVSGPTNVTTTTSTDGCAIIAVSPGEYKLDVRRTGYVDPNGYTNSNEDSATNGSFYVVAEETIKKSFEFAPAGGLTVSFENPITKSVAEGGDSFVAFNTAMKAPQRFPKLESERTTVPTANSGLVLFPFTSEYTVYAGTCEADAPATSVMEENKAKFHVLVPAGKANPITTLEPPVNVKVMSGTEAGTTHEGHEVTNGAGSTTDACGVKRSFTSTPLPHPGQPFGRSSMCVGATIIGKEKKWEGTFENNRTSGPSTSWTNGGTSGGVATIYLGLEPSGTPPGAGKVESGHC